LLFRRKDLCFIKIGKSKNTLSTGTLVSKYFPVERSSCQ